MTRRNEEVVSTPGLATINPPDTPTVITELSSSCEIIGFKVDREYVQREMDRLLADTVESYRRSWIFALGRVRIGYAWYV